jgi:hypothetical protein
VLFNQQGEGFKNAGACTKYGAKGGQIAGVDAVAGPAVRGFFKATCSGFGLLFLASVSVDTNRIALYGTHGEGLSGSNAADGTVSITATFPCTFRGGKFTSLEVEAITAQSTIVDREFPLPTPSGC